MDDVPETQNQDIIKYSVIAGLLIIIAIAFFTFSGVDFLGSEPTKMLVIGSTTQETIQILNENRNTIDYTSKTANSLEANSEEQLKDYKIIMLDQSEEATKEISKELGDALQNFVKKGGNLIVIKDSGIKRPDTQDVIGWEPTFLDLIPVKCNRIGDNELTCANKKLVVGKLIRATEHPIMQGIEQFPAGETLNATFETFEVDNLGTEIAYIQSSAANKKSYIGISEKKTMLGKTIYFNYNVGKTRGIFEATLDYLG